jgi:molybdate transport repressor ModE-like protein
MRIEVRPTIICKSRIGEECPIDLVWVADLLRNIASTTSLNQAAKFSGLSYRGAWDKLNEVEAAMNLELVVRTKGHGSKLTPFGEFFIAYVEDMKNASSDFGDSFQATLSNEIGKFKKQEAVRWKFSSSSDAIIQKAVGEIKGFDLKIAGSGESLDRLLNNEADLAGYHVSDQASSKTIYTRLSKNNIQIFPVMMRVQGLMVKKGNPLKIDSILDLVNPKIRFINRQIGSGTRVLFDTLLISENIDPLEINGYMHEEFTHSAVANAILAGKADVGLGVKSVALENKLDFIPLKDEIFFVAMNKEMASQSEASKLIRKIRSYSGETPGYKAVSLNRQIEGWL